MQEGTNHVSPCQLQAGKGQWGRGITSRITTLKGSLSPLSPAPSYLSLCGREGGSDPKGQKRVELGVQALLWTAGLQGPPVQRPGHPPLLCQTRAAGCQHGQVAHRGGSISLSLSDSAMGDRDKKPMRHPWAPCQVPTAACPLLQFCGSLGYAQRTPEAVSGDPAPNHLVASSVHASEALHWAVALPFWGS